MSQPHEVPRLVVVPTPPHPVVGVPPWLDRKSKAAFPSVLTPQTRQRGLRPGLKDLDSTDSEQTYLGLFSPGLNADADCLNCGRGKERKY